MMLSFLVAAAVGVTPIDRLKEDLANAAWSLDSIRNEPFAAASLSKDEASQASALIWSALSARLRADRKAEWESKSITLDGKTMKFDFRTFGEVPKTGRSLFISMHGGGETAAKINDQQWRNQIRLYTSSEGIYLAPAPPPTPGTCGTSRTSIPCSTASSKMPFFSRT